MPKIIIRKAVQIIDLSREMLLDHFVFNPPVSDMVKCYFPLKSAQLFRSWAPSSTGCGNATTVSSASIELSQKTPLRILLRK